MKVKVNNISSGLLALPSPLSVTLAAGRGTILSISEPEWKAACSSPAIARLIQTRMLSMAAVQDAPPAPKPAPVVEAPVVEAAPEPPAPVEEPKAEPAPAAEPDAAAEPAAEPVVEAAPEPEAPEAPAEEPKAEESAPEAPVEEPKAEAPVESKKKKKKN